MRSKAYVTVIEAVLFLPNLLVSLQCTWSLTFSEELETYPSPSLGAKEGVSKIKEDRPGKDHTKDPVYPAFPL
jgi:hypothetical protein